MTTELVSNPAGPVPARPTKSVRRTSTLDSTWPKGREGLMRMEGRCRDLMTRSTTEDFSVLAEDVAIAHLDDNRVIKDITNQRVDLSELAGAKGGGHLRSVLDNTIHEERVNGTPLYLVLDDISGASLVSGWAWSRWAGDEDDMLHREGFEERRMFMENVCHGFATGNSALSTSAPPQNNPPVVPLANPDDPHSWHDLPITDSVNFRRARYIDVTINDQMITIDVGFQDSATDPELGRVAIHEYRLEAKADLAEGVLTEISATPYILPFPECPGAVNNIQVLVGIPLRDMRTRVIDELPGVKGCTHLNDVMRGLAEVPVLAGHLQ